MADRNAERGRKRKEINPGQGAGSKIQKNSLISVEGAHGPVEFHSDAVKSGFTNFGDGNDIRDVIGINYNSSTSTPNSKSEKDTMDIFLKIIVQLLEQRAKEDVAFVKAKGITQTPLERLIQGYQSSKSPKDLLTFKKLIRSIGIIRSPSYAFGTIFLAEVDCMGPCLLSAGHNFKEILNDKSDQQTMGILNNFRARFGDIDGNIPDVSEAGNIKSGEPMSLKVFFQEFCVRGAIQLEGKRKIFKRERDVLVTEFKEFKLGEFSAYTDYCAILLDEKIKDRLDELGLDLLECGTGNQLHPKPGCILEIMGHPAVEEPKGSGKYPRRIAYGMEKEEVKGIATLIESDYDSLGGNSGSPVFDENYKVKGIHVRGNQKVENFDVEKSNWMQKISDIKLD